MLSQSVKDKEILGSALSVKPAARTTLCPYYKTRAQMLYLAYGPYTVLLTKIISAPQIKKIRSEIGAD